MTSLQELLQLLHEYIDRVSRGRVIIRRNNSGSRVGTINFSGTINYSVPSTWQSRSRSFRRYTISRRARVVRSPRISFRPCAFLIARKNGECPLESTAPPSSRDTYFRAAPSSSSSSSWNGWYEDRLRIVSLVRRGVPSVSVRFASTSLHEEGSSNRGGGGQPATITVPRTRLLVFASAYPTTGNDRSARGCSFARQSSIFIIFRVRRVSGLPIARRSRRERETRIASTPPRSLPDENSSPTKSHYTSAGSPQNSLTVSLAANKLFLRLGDFHNGLRRYYWSSELRFFVQGTSNHCVLIQSEVRAHPR